MNPRATVCAVVLSISVAPAAAQTIDDRIRALIAAGDRDSAESVARFDTAFASFAEADRLARGSADPVLRAEARQRLCFAHFNSSKHSEGVSVCAEAADLADAAQAPAIKGLARRMQGVLLVMLARYSDSEVFLREAAELAERYGSSDDAIRALNSLAANAHLQGRLGSSIEYARQALALVDRELARGVKLSVRALFAPAFNLGKSLADSGDFIAAAPYLDRAFNVAVEYNDLGGQQHLFGDSGEWYEAQGDTGRAERYYKRLVEFTRAHWRGAEGEGKGLLGLGRLALAGGRPEDAVALMSDALRIFRDGQFVHLQTLGLVQRARAHAAAGNDDLAARDLADAITLATRTDQTSNLVLALIERGRQRTRGRDLIGARADFETAIAHSRRDRLFPVLPSAFVGLGEIEEARGDQPAAVRAYEQAAEALDLIRGRIVSPELRANFAAATHDTFAGMARLLLAMHQPERAVMVLERERLQALDLAITETRAAGKQRSPEARIAQLQTALFASGLEDRTRQALLRSLDDAERDLTLAGGDDAVAAARRRVPALDEVRSVLAPHEVIVEYSLLHDRAVAFLIDRERTRVIPLELPPDLPDRIEFFIRALEENARRPAIASGRRLSNTLLMPVLREIPAGARILIVATGELARLPFAALPVAGHANFDEPLVTRHEIAYLSSMTLLTEERQQPDVRDWRVLAVADAGSAEARSRGLAPLPGSRSEARAITAISPASQLLEGGNATERTMKSSMTAGYSVVHFATHALLDAGVPERSAVLLTAADGDDGLLQAREIYELPLQGTLVVLSGCRTADGRTSGAEGLRSIARAFLQAGGRSVVGALWDVPDASAARLIVDFYSHLERGRDAGAALRQAQLAAAGRDPYSNSRTWASMILLGDPALGLASRGRGQVGWVLVTSASLLLAAALVMFISRGR